MIRLTLLAVLAIVLTTFALSSSPAPASFPDDDPNPDACDGKWDVDAKSNPFTRQGAGADCDEAADDAEEDLESDLITLMGCPGCSENYSGCVGEGDLVHSSYTCTDLGDGQWNVHFRNASTRARCTVCVAD